MEPFAFFKSGSILGVRLPNHVRPLEGGGRVYRDVGSSGTLSHNGATIAEVAEPGTPGVKDGSATDVVREIADGHDAAHHDLREPWPPFSS